MKVMHLMTHLDSGGISLYILNLIPSLKRLGCETHVFSSGGELRDLFQQAGAITTEANIRTKSELDPRLYAALPALVRKLKSEKFDLIHAHNRPSQVMAYWAARFAKIPYVTTCHGFYKRRLGRRLLPAWGDLTIAISPGVAEHLKNDFGISPQKIRIVPNGVNAEALRMDSLKHRGAKQNFGWTDDAVVISCIARLVEVKGQGDLIEAFAGIHEKYPQARLLIAGEGRERGEYEKKAAASGLGNKIVFTGNVRDISPVLAATDIFVHPATWQEAFGLGIIEAMACGKPAIVTDTWALKDFFSAGENVFLVPPADPKSLAAMMSTLISTPHLRSDAGIKGQKIAGELFSLNNFTEGILRAYKDALTLPGA